MEIRTLAREELGLIRQIDRSEVVERIFLHTGGKLELVERHFDVSNGWWQEKEVSRKILPGLESLHDDGGFVYGAFEDGKLVGITALDGKIRGSRAVLDALFVSLSHRGKGVARALVGAVAGKARELGASRLYVSATPSERTVGFYKSCGFEVAQRVEPDLFEKEPEDIHMEMEL